MSVQQKAYSPKIVYLSLQDDDKAMIFKKYNAAVKPGNPPKCNYYNVRFRPGRRIDPTTQQCVKFDNSKGEESEMLVRARNLYVQSGVDDPKDPKKQTPADKKYLKMKLRTKGTDFGEMEYLIDKLYEKRLKECTGQSFEKKSFYPVVSYKYDSEFITDERYKGKDRPDPVVNIRVEFDTFSNGTKKCRVFDATKPIPEADGSIKMDKFGVAERCEEVNLTFDNAHEFLKAHCRIVKCLISVNSASELRSQGGNVSLIQCFREIYVIPSVSSREVVDEEEGPGVDVETSESSAASDISAIDKALNDMTTN